MQSGSPGAAIVVFIMIILIIGGFSSAAEGAAVGLGAVVLTLFWIGIFIGIPVVIAWCCLSDTELGKSIQKWWNDFNSQSNKSDDTPPKLGRYDCPKCEGTGWKPVTIHGKQYKERCHCR
jgi:hypothetical protein